MRARAAPAAWGSVVCVLLGACDTGSGPAVAQAVADDAEAGAPEGMTASLREADGAAGEAVEAAWMASGPQCGAVLTRSTTLRQDLGPCPDVGLVLGADDVTLDCDGHRVMGDVKAEDRAGLHIVNCRVEGAIELRETIGAYVEHNEMHTFVVVDGVGDTVRDNRIAPGGAEITGNAIRFIDNEMPGPDAVLLVFGASGRVSGNRIEGSIELDGTAHRIDSNELHGGYMLVEDTTGGRIEGNSLRDSVYGFSVLDASHNRFVGNEVEDGEANGFIFWGGAGSSRNLVRDNEAFDNANVGIWIDHGSNDNALIRNEACDNGAVDLRDEAAGTVLLGNDFCTEGVL